MSTAWPSLLLAGVVVLGAILLIGQHRAYKRLEAWEQRWGDLARYNSERSRGILHDSITDTRMAQKQEAYRQAMLDGFPMTTKRRIRRSA